MQRADIRHGNGNNAEVNAADEPAKPSEYPDSLFFRHKQRFF